jgi:DNA polymerase-1
MLYGGVKLSGKPDLNNIQKLDLLPVPQIRRMSRYGIAIDREYLWDLGSQFALEMAQLQKDISSYIPADSLDRFVTAANQVEEVEGTAELNANSADQIRTLVYDLLGVGKGKPIKLTSNGKMSTGRKQLEQCRDDHPVIPLILDYRERSKLKSTYCDGLPKRARQHPKSRSCPLCELPHVESTWRVHTEFLTTRAETGRFASKNPNLQNIPLKTKLGALIREAFKASAGTKLVGVDFSQIELRDLAHLSNCESMRRVYDAGGDIHLDTTLRCFNLTDVKVAKQPRYRVPSKIGNFSIAYQISARELCSHLNYTFGYLYASGDLTEAEYRSLLAVWTEEACQKFIDEWFAQRPEVREYLDLQAYRVRRYGFCWDPFGRIRRVPEIHSCHPYIRSAGLRQAGNMPIQSMSAGQIKLAMAECEAAFNIYLDSDIWVWPLLTIHDQIIAEVEEGWAEEVKMNMTMIFDGVMNDRQTDECLSRVPIKSDGEIMDRWKKE